MHEEVTQRFGGGWIGTDFLQSLQGQGTLTGVPGAANSVAFRELLFALKIAELGQAIVVENLSETKPIQLSR